MTTELTLKNENGESTVKVNDFSMTLADLYEHVIQPLLLAAGYQQKTIDDVFGDGE
jgi:hypothetical protein